jgi:hypothetical protein
MRLVFRGMQRTSPLPLAGAIRAAGRLRVPLELHADLARHALVAGRLTTTTSTESVRRDVELYGPQDVAGLAPGAIVRTSPPDGAGDVDGEFCAFVEFRAPDLPWRYAPTADGVPWLALVAGIEDRELGLDPDGALWLDASLTAALDPSGAASWAHAQGEPAHSSRLLCVRSIPAGSRCLAAVVPLLDGAGVPRWQPGRAHRGLPVLHRFRFTTNDAGTFEDLVAALRPVPRPAGLGEATVHAGGLGSLAVLGALAPVAAPDAPPLPAEVADRVTELLGSSTHLPPGQAVLEPVLGAPIRSTPFRLDDTAPWLEVDTDPRHRAAAGLGARAGVEWQERIMRAAAERLGDTHRAARLLGHLTAGVALAERAATRQPAGPADRLAFLGPALPSVAVTGGTTALAHLCPPGRALPAALLSSAAAHLLRPSGAAAKASAAPGAVGSPGRVVEAALRCPPPAASPVEPTEPLVPDFDLERALDALREAGVEVEVDDLRALLEAHEQPDPEPEEPDCAEPDPQWLDEAVGALDQAFRPRGAAVARVMDRIAGLHEAWDEPLEVHPDLDLPVWDWLRRRAPEWLLPRAGLIPPNGIVALRTNRSFVAACLIGASHQAVSELRWRGVPVRAGAMPMRTFWQHVASPENPPPMVDLVQPSSWPAVPLDLLPGARGAGAELVIALRSDLVRRYPDTEVYLAPALAPDGTRTGDLDHPIAPSFAGRLEPDVWCFGFPVPPATLPDLVLVLEEPDRGPRFHPSTGVQAGAHEVTRMTYDADGVGRPVTVGGLRDGGAYAGAAYANPIRAICDGATLLHPGELP